VLNLYYVITIHSVYGEINMMMMMMTEKTLDEYTTRTAHKFIVDDSKSILKYAKCHETTALCIRKVKLCEIWYKT